MTDWRPWALRAHHHTPISLGHERLAHTPLSSVGRKWVHFSLSRIRAARGAATRETRAHRERTPCVYVGVDSPESKQLQQRRSTGRNQGPDGRWTELFAVAGLRFPRCRRRKPSAFLHAESHRGRPAERLDGEGEPEAASPQGGPLNSPAQASDRRPVWWLGSTGDSLCLFSMP